MDTVISGAPAPGVPDVDPLTTARAYGNVYLRLRLGANGRTSLDCLTGSVSVLNSSVAYSPAGNLPVADGGDRGRYTILPAAAPRFASVTPRVTPKLFSCIDGLGSYIGRELNAYDITVRTGNPGTYTAGSPYTLTGVRLDVTLSAAMLKGLYETLLNYSQLPPGGVVDQPLSIWVALAGANTVEGLRIVKIDGRWQGRFDDPDGVIGSGDETFEDVALSYAVPPSTWTPTGNGPLAFSIAAPGQIPELTLVGKPGNQVFGMWPYGSLFVRAETGRYAASIDCLEGGIDFADISISRSNLGRRDPTLRIPTPVAAGAPPATTTVPAGSLGRYSITHEPSPPFAIVPTVQAATPPPSPAPKPLAKAAVRSSKLAVKRKRLSVSLGCGDGIGPCTGTVRVRTTSKVTLGKSRKQIDLTKAVKYSVAATGSKSISLALSKDARKVLAKRKSLSVTVIVTPASGAAITRKVTLKA